MEQTHPKQPQSEVVTRRWFQLSKRKDFVIMGTITGYRPVREGVPWRWVSREGHCRGAGGGVRDHLGKWLLQGCF